MISIISQKKRISPSGSGIGFLALAGLIADIFFMHVHRLRSTFREGKISVVDVDRQDDAQLIERA